MSNQDAAFGLRPVKTSTSSQRQNRYRIASGYGTGIFQGDLVLVATDGTITRAPAGATNLILTYSPFVLSSTGGLEWISARIV